jgi:hypothetical protein
LKRPDIGEKYRVDLVTLIKTGTKSTFVAVPHAVQKALSRGTGGNAEKKEGYMLSA